MQARFNWKIVATNKISCGFREYRCELATPLGVHDLGVFVCQVLAPESVPQDLRFNVIEKIANDELCHKLTQIAERN